MKIEWALYVDGDTEEEVYYEQLDATLYQSQYVDHLFCITENCEVEMKFTERKNGTKFFSAMNGQGDKHLVDCPYYTNYEGEVPRKKLIGVPTDGEVSDDWILNTLLNKSRDLKNTNNPRPKRKREPGTTKRVVNAGEQEVPVPIDGGLAGTGQTELNIRYGSINSNFVTKDFLGQRKRVVGTALHAEVVEENDEAYGYIRLKNDSLQIDAYFPPAFYADSRLTTRAAMEAFLGVLNRAIVSGQKITVICLGLLEENRNGNGININITNYKHIIANDDQYYKIIRNGTVSDNPYPD
ncbi:hypothetical protein [Paenibacillus naphthalenovorans]|uniref:Uncharacterized protein n=1 Tax=Paenibacillus naphthalenovorans TaxID=162209 RepID=A0A0U2UAV5_9BACL|nr:hypothetical protein [Paenibacillus naphthalenovorans]ALS23401.1 hypothetical protein IJ22_30280 [Paenibacillus naphthalenovorans]